MTTIKINNVSDFFLSFLWKDSFNDENELIDKIIEYKNEKNLDDALKSEELKNSFKTLSSII